MWYKPDKELELLTPSVLVYPERIEENIRRMIAVAGSADRLRPHVKTHKLAEVLMLQVKHGILKFKCATLTEVEMVAANGGTDILLAYPLFGPGIPLFLDLHKRYPEVKFSVTVDSLGAAEELGNQARREGMPLGVLVDLDTGMHRTGIQPAQAGTLIESIQDHPLLSFQGLHIYDGHIHQTDVGARKKQCDRDFEPVKALIKELEGKGIQVEELACGGTPTFPIRAQDPSRTLCPGTPLLWDAGYAAGFPDLDFLHAAVVAGRVISKPLQHICLDLGHKSIASEMPQPRLKFLNLDVGEVIVHSEEHLVVSAERSAERSPGELVFALPVHICPTMALHEQVYVVEAGRVTGTWKVVARSRIYS